MPVASFSSVRSFSSSDPSFPASNLLSAKKWKCKEKGQEKATVVLALNEPKEITSVHIGNDNSAFIEVLVGRAEGGKEAMKVLLPAASFMTPMDSRNDLNAGRVRMFAKDQLNADISGEKWDLVKVVCTQPFNKHVKYGLAFIQVNVVEDKEKEEKKPEEKLGAFTLKAESALMADDYKSAFSKRKLLGAIKGGMRAEMRNDKTLAGMALQKNESEQEKKSEFYQLKKESYKSPVVKKEAVKLPRRDVMPGEDSPPRKRRKEEPEERKKESPVKQKPKSYKPFKELLKGVVFTISGIQNPTRGDLRSKGIDLGAKYRPDWDSQCTHLICAFASTPKFNQVKKEGRGKIVKKDWIERCHKDKKRIPWRRFCLDPKDGKRAESEDEVWDERLAPPSESNGDCEGRKGRSASQLAEEDDMDTDEEIEAIERREKKEKYDQDTDEEVEAAVVKKEKFDQDTDDEEEKKKAELSDSAYDASTDEDEKVEKKKSPIKAMASLVKEEKVSPIKIKKERSPSPKPKAKVYNDDSDAAFDIDTDVDSDNEEWPELPEFFSKTKFFLSGFSASEERGLQRKVVAAGGSVQRYMTAGMRFVVTSSCWQDKFEGLLKDSPRLKFVKPSFVHSCWKEQKMLSWEDYAVRRK